MGAKDPGRPRSPAPASRGRFSRRTLLAGGTALWAAPWAGSGKASAAQDWPARPVRLVVPLAPGGSVDIAARLVGNELTPLLGQRIVVENRPGASGTIGVQVVASSPPDGYTLVIGSSSTFGVNPSLFKALPYDPIGGFAPVSQISLAPNVLVVGAGVPVSTVTELVRLAEKEPGRLSFASSGYGGSPHLAGELFKQSAGIDIVHIPYKGTGEAMADLLGGRVEMSFGTVIAVLDQVKAGKLKALAVTSDERVSALPDVPTMAEAGFPGVRITAWNGILAPAHTPGAIVDRLSDAIRAVVRSPEMTKRLEQEGAVPVGSTPAAFALFIRDEIERWGKIVRAAGLSLD